MNVSAGPDFQRKEMQIANNCRVSRCTFDVLRYEGESRSDEAQVKAT